MPPDVTRALLDVATLHTQSSKVEGRAASRARGAHTVKVPRASCTRCRASRSSMRAGYLEPSTCLRRPTAHRTRADTFAVPLLARVTRCSRRSHQHMRLYGSTGLEQKGNRSAPRSPTGTIVVSVGKRALARHLAHPDIGLPWSIEDFALLRVSAARALVRDILLLHRTSQHFTAFTARAVRRISDAACSLQRPCGPSVLPSRSSRVFIFLCEQLVKCV